MAQKITHSLTLWAKCDRCGEAEHWTNLDAASALEHAKVDGWRLSADRDLCPTCVREDAN